MRVLGLEGWRVGKVRKVGGLVVFEVWSLFLLEFGICLFGDLFIGDLIFGKKVGGVGKVGGLCVGGFWFL